MGQDRSVRVPRVLLPRPGIDVARWAVIACDQFTAEPDYWAEVERTVGDAPSTLRMILPELHLHAPDVDARIAACQDAMRRYVAEGLLVEHAAPVYVERRMSRGVQRGLLVEIDLDAYDYSPTGTTPIRSTEGTVVDRLPPRVAVRRDADLEVPHVLVLYDDPDGTVLAAVDAARDSFVPAYDAELMGGSGHVTGSLIPDADAQRSILDALDALVAPEAYAARYGLDADAPLHLAIGDGNHSLAAAATIWSELKASGADPDHPARHALVELVNLHDASLAFEPIHRVLFDAPGVVEDLRVALDASTRPVDTLDAVLAAVASDDGGQRFGIVDEDGFAVAELPDPTHQLAVGSLQTFLDAWLAENPDAEIDYVHGEDVTVDLARRPGNVGFLLPGIGKDAFFRSIAVDGPLPRKTFSMGHAHDKRFYMEARAIR